MDMAVVAGVSLEYMDSGTGDPVVCIHGAFIADAFEPLASEHPIADRYRLIRYHRRGYGGSSPSGAHVSLPELARDCQTMMSHLDVRRAQLVGHSRWRDRASTGVGRPRASPYTQPARGCADDR
jgi:pimeloyl-ACP methyl ester carboxylesterase